MLAKGITRSVLLKTGRRFIRTTCIPHYAEGDVIEFQSLSRVVRIRKPGDLFPEPIDPNYRLGREPIYDSPSGDVVSLVKRFSAVTSVFASAFGGIAAYSLDWSAVSGTLFSIGLLTPLPVTAYLTTPYVWKIYRYYKRGETQTYENLTEDETLIVERSNLWGTPGKYDMVKVKHLRLDNGRFGWINMKQSVKNRPDLKLYVADNVGGMKMDRIWGIVEKQSGVNNGREFLNEEVDSR